MVRDRIEPELWDRTLAEVRGELDRRIAEKGDGAFASMHEAWGKIEEEVREFKDAVHEKDQISARAELLDIIVAAVVALASSAAAKGCGECGKTGHSAEDHSESLI